MDTASISQNFSAPLQARSNGTAVKSLAPFAKASRLNFELNGANAAIEYACNKWAYSDILKFMPFHVDWSASYEDPIELEMLYVGDRERSVARHFQGRRDTPYCSITARSSGEYKDVCIANMQYIVNSCGFLTPYSLQFG